MTHSPRNRRLPSWRFWLPLAVQVLFVLTIPAQSLYAYLAGTSVVLQTAPVDPYNLLQGYYVTLRYDISQVSTLETLPGWEAVSEQSDTDPNEQDFYVVLEAPEDGTSVSGEMPLPWQPVRVTGDRPTDLPTGQVALRGRRQYGTVIYGLEQYFIPEDQRDDINDRIRQVQQSGNPQSYVVEVKVTPQGTTTPISLWVDGMNYRF